MPDSTIAKTDLEAITGDIAALKRDVAALVEHARSGAVSRATNAATQLREEATEMYGRLTAEGANSAKMISRQVEEQPIASLFVAFALGFASGRLLAR
jgi:ElaB/YqjD/DUF883 family membrane-anchored ribosome-binding protein